MTPPSKLYRFRPLEDGLLQRELDALSGSYVFAPPFAAMNDPMEAFYETGGPGDSLVDALLNQSDKKVADLYAMVDEMIAKFALVSFTGTHLDLPMWAYYGTNFAGMCLEFDAASLSIGDFQGENLLPVTYAKTALPPISLADLGGDIGAAVTARITRKRIEWAHEKEWRYIAGAVGPKHHLDDALRRIYLGPRVKPEHARRVREVMAGRPVEILQGVIRGYELNFEPVQAAMPLDQCERVGAGLFDPADHDFAHDDLKAFLGGTLDGLWSYCADMVRRPNLEAIDSIDRSGSADAIYIWARYKLRSDREVYFKTLLDRRLRALPG